MRLFVGTSGYSYKEWKGNVYPDDARPQDMLRLYAERLNTVEINTTFYRMPSETMLPGWSAQVPTAAFGYLRLSREDYADEQMQHWVDRIGRQPWDKAWVFFEHDDEGAGPRLASRFKEEAGS